MLRQKDYKQMKKEVVEDTAVNVGYLDGILQVIPDYALMEAMREIAINGWLTVQTKDGDLHNMLVTESIKAMNYQDFKEVAPYLFSYPAEQHQEDFLVRPISVSREYFEELKAKADELFYLKEDIKKVNQDIDRKIEELETDRLPNGDKVVGVDMEKEELLLLRAPENSYIDDWEVEREGLITDYRSTQPAEVQILLYLAKRYPDIQAMVREDVLNQDKLDGFVEVDKAAIREVSTHSVPDFKSHRAFYDYAKDYASFQEAYPSYAAYVNQTYELHYPIDIGLHYYGQAILEGQLVTINDILKEKGKELVLVDNSLDNGSMQLLGYLRDQNTESLEEVLHYLNHQVGAYYRGSLGELAVIRLDNIDPEKGYNGKHEQRYPIDHDELGRDMVQDIHDRYPELDRFVSPAQIQQGNQDLVKNRPEAHLSR